MQYVDVASFFFELNRAFLVSCPEPMCDVEIQLQT